MAPVKVVLLLISLRRSQSFFSNYFLFGEVWISRLPACIKRFHWLKYGNEKIHSYGLFVPHSRLDP